MDKTGLIKNFQKYVTEEESEKLYHWLIDNFRALSKNPEEKIKELLHVDMVIAGKLLEEIYKTFCLDSGIYFT